MYEKQIQTKGSLRMYFSVATYFEWNTYEGHYPRWRLGHPTLSHYQGREQATAPRLRQAHDLLSPVRTDAGWD